MHKMREKPEALEELERSSRGASEELTYRLHKHAVSSASAISLLRRQKNLFMEISKK
jgi:hypothetical protein